MPGWLRPAGFPTQRQRMRPGASATSTSATPTATNSVSQDRFGDRTPCSLGVTTVRGVLGRRERAGVPPSGHNDVVSTYLSPSGASLWKQCPRRWWYRYVDGLPEPPPGEPAVLGSFVHKVLEDLLDLPAPDRTPDAARAIATECFATFSERGDYRALGFDDSGTKRFKHRAWVAISAYFSEFAPSEVDPVRQEMRVRAEIDGVPFFGIIDLVERDGDLGGNAVIVTDYKTGTPPETNKPWSAEQNAEKLLQPMWYAAALLEMGEHSPSLARLLYFTAAETADGGFVGRTGTLAAPVNEGAIAAARAELLLRWRQIGEAQEHGGAEAKPGVLCGWCPFVAHCTEGQAEVRRLRAEVNPRTGAPRMRDDAPAVVELGLV